MTRRHRYAELHAHSAYSFLDGANEPEDLVASAVELGLEALALTDHDGLPGIVKHAEAGRAHGLPTVHGAELALEGGARLPVLARDPVGYRRLSAAVSHHNLSAGHRADPAHRLPELAPWQLLLLTRRVHCFSKPTLSHVTAPRRNLDGHDRW